MTFNLAPSVSRISKNLKSQTDVLGCLRILCQMRAPIELLRQFEIQKLVKNITSLQISSEISNLAEMVDMKIQKMEELEKKKKIQEELASKVFMEKVLSFKWIHPSKFVRTRKYSCDSVSTSSSSSSSTSPTHDTEDVPKQDVPSEIKLQRQEKKRQRRLGCDFEFKKDREGRRRAKQTEKEEEMVIAPERKTKKSNGRRVLYRPY